MFTKEQMRQIQNDAYEMYQKVAEKTRAGVAEHGHKYQFFVLQQLLVFIFDTLLCSCDVTKGDRKKFLDHLVKELTRRVDMKIEFTEEDVSPKD